MIFGESRATPHGPARLPEIARSAPQPHSEVGSGTWNCTATLRLPPTTWNVRCRGKSTRPLIGCSDPVTPSFSVVAGNWWGCRWRLDRRREEVAATGADRLFSRCHRGGGRCRRFRSLFSTTARCGQTDHGDDRSTARDCGEAASQTTW